jgi:Right handed beta helix region
VRSFRRVAIGHRRSISLSFILLLILSDQITNLRAKTGVFRRVTPEDAWCAAVNSAQPGDEFVFAAGDYPEPCSIRASGNSAAGILIRSEGEDSRAKFSYPGYTSNVVQVFGSFLTIRGFEFRPSSKDVHSLRIMGGAHDVTVEGNLFSGVGNVALSANNGSTADLVIRDNVFLNLENTAAYVGCHDGSCVSTNLRFERNYINGVRAADPDAVGYGIEVKLNSWGVIRDNTIVNTKGPPIMTYGSNQPAHVSLIEGNYVEGSRGEGGIVIGGGPAIVRNNIAVNNANGGISAQNYDRRNLQKSIWIVHNTLINNSDSGINTQGWAAGSDNVIAYNAILPKSLTPAFRLSGPVDTIMSNITCSASCFVNALTAPYDLWPAAGSLLVDIALPRITAWKPSDDFMGKARDERPDAGAMERTHSASDHRVSGKSLRPPRASGR